MARTLARVAHATQHCTRGTSFHIVAKLAHPFCFSQGVRTCEGVGGFRGEQLLSSRACALLPDLGLREKLALLREFTPKSFDALRER